MRELRKSGHFDNRHSRWVARLKVMLPLTALAILSTLFLVADRRGSTGLTFSDAETMDRLLTEGRVSRPAYSGVAENGASISFDAEEATPVAGSDDETEARQVRGTWHSPSGAEIVLTGNRGFVNNASGDVEVEGEVLVIDAQGYELESERLEIDGATKNILSPGPVVGTGPSTRLKAGAMKIEQRSDQPLAIFTGGVRVVYDPQPAE